MLPVINLCRFCQVSRLQVLGRRPVWSCALAKVGCQKSHWDDTKICYPFCRLTMKRFSTRPGGLLRCSSPQKNWYGLPQNRGRSVNDCLIGYIEVPFSTLPGCTQRVLVMGQFWCLSKGQHAPRQSHLDPVLLSRCQWSSSPAERNQVKIKIGGSSACSSP